MINIFVVKLSEIKVRTLPIYVVTYYFNVGHYHKNLPWVYGEKVISSNAYSHCRGTLKKLKITEDWIEFVGEEFKNYFIRESEKKLNS